MAHDRRAFLKLLGLGSTALVGGTRVLEAALPLGRVPATRIQRLGIQLYSLRDRAATDLGGVLEALSKIGYSEVETAGYYGHPAAEVRELLDRNHLKAPSAHIGIEAIETKGDRTFADAKVIGHEWLTVASPPTPIRTIGEWEAFAARLNRAGTQAKAAGFRFAYHNHDAEFRVLDGVAPWDVLMRETDPNIVTAEIDLYHATVGGADPLDLLARYGSRIKMLHVKDMSPSSHKMVDVGAGTIHFKPIFAHAKGIEHYFVENDNPADSMQFAANSYSYLSTLEF
jgi:sugar phosphate isomerase/epimerase